MCLLRVHSTNGFVIAVGTCFYTRPLEIYRLREVEFIAGKNYGLNSCTERKY